MATWIPTAASLHSPVSVNRTYWPYPCCVTALDRIWGRHNMGKDKFRQHLSRVIDAYTGSTSVVHASQLLQHSAPLGQRSQCRERKKTHTHTHLKRTEPAQAWSSLLPLQQLEKTLWWWNIVMVTKQKGSSFQHHVQALAPPWQATTLTKLIAANTVWGKIWWLMIIFKPALPSNT